MQQRKKIRLDKEEKPVSAKLFSDAMSKGVLSSTLLFLNRQEAGNVTSVSKIFNSLYKSETTWRNLYEAHFGRLYWQKDYQEQYIAEELRRHNRADELRDYIESKRFDTGKRWTDFYWAIIEYCVMSRNPFESAFNALQWGDLKVVEFLVRYFRETKNYDETDLRKVLSLCHFYNKDGYLNRQMCLFYGMLYKETINAEEKPVIKQKTLDYFFQSIDCRDTSIELFKILFIPLFMRIELINRKNARIFLRDEELVQRSNVLEVLAYCRDSRRFLDNTPVNNWFKQLADNGNAAAAYHYAQGIYYKPDYIHTAKDYYVKALQEHEYRAANGLRQLRLKHPKLVSRKELIDLIMPGAVARNSLCTLVLAKQYCAQPNWYTDPFKVWIMQSATLIEPRYKRVHDALAEKVKLPDAKYLYCAFIFIHWFRDRDTPRAAEKLLLTHSIDPSLPEEYLAKGREFNLCSAKQMREYKDFLAVLKVRCHPPEEPPHYNLRARRYPSPTL